jgi:nucleoid DNA-binding protein
MYDELLQYLLLYKELPVPGIGSFSLERRPAAADITNRVINPPVYQVSLREHTDPYPRHFFSWLAAQLSTSDHDARERFRQFSASLQSRLSSGKNIHWPGIGNLEPDEAGRIRFRPDITEGEAPVPAQKIIRENAEHQIRVGEDMKTSVQMSEMLTVKPEKKRYPLLFAWLLLLLCVAFIAWYAVTNGLDGVLQYR